MSVRKTLNDDQLEYYRKWRENNKDRVKQYKQKWCDGNRDAIYKYNHDVLLPRGKEPIICDCGSMVTKAHLKRHKQTKKHNILLEIIS